MKVVEIKDIARKETGVHYRRIFSGYAVLEHVGGPAVPTQIEFTLELSPLGSTEIKVDVKDDLNYPLVPAIRALTDHIRKLDKEGLLH